MAFGPSFARQRSNWKSDSKIILPLVSCLGSYLLLQEVDCTMLSVSKRSFSVRCDRLRSVGSCCYDAVIMVYHSYHVVVASPFFWNRGLLHFNNVTDERIGILSLEMERSCEFFIKEPDFSVISSYTNKN